MTTGEGIFASTALAVVFASIYFLSLHKQWKKFFKVIAGTFLVAGIGALVTWGIISRGNDSTDKLEKMTSLAGISLGMKEVEVTLAKGKPEEISKAKPVDEGFSKLMYYDDLYLFLRGPKDSMRVITVCSDTLNDKVLGLGFMSSEDQIISKLGEPDSVSINAEGLKKLINYPIWNAAYELRKGHVSTVCVTGRESLSYASEYGDE